MLTRLLPLIVLLLWTVLPAQAHAQDASPLHWPADAPVGPPALCPLDLTCGYTEYNLAQAGIRAQALTACGANCSTAYWITDAESRRPVLVIERTRGGAILAAQRRAEPAGGYDRFPALRVVRPTYQSGDAMCCPSQYADTTYAWDDATSAYRAVTPRTIPSADYNRDRILSDLSAARFVTLSQ